MFRPSKQRSPPGFPECPPPGLALANQQHALTQAVVGQVQAMLVRFEQSFEKHLSQVEAQTPRERSRSPLGRSTSRLRRSDDFSSQEESLANDDGKLASVVHELSPRAVQASHKIILPQDGTNGLLTISLGTGKDGLAGQIDLPSSHTTSDA